MHSFDVGRRFLDYYRDEGYEVLPGESLLDPLIPTTFVMSAGLSQIEATIDQSREHVGKRCVLLQTCFRHFDLDNIGDSPYHLSLFRMNGAFSFGPTRREHTLAHMWRLLTRELGISEANLRVTYFAGGQLEGCSFEEDVETLQAWHALGLSPTWIFPSADSEGLWKQGGGLSGKERFRKCALTTEIFYDHGLGAGCKQGCHPGCSCGRYVEIANILFIRWQFDQETKAFTTLATGFDESVIGVERVAMVLQKKPSVFTIASLDPLMVYVGSLSGGSENGNSQKQLVSERVIVDHIRALLFLTADNAPPPSKRWGRPRIMRLLIRAVLTHQRMLGITLDDFVPGLIAKVLELNRTHYPHLEQGCELLVSYFAQERENFEHTLAAGYRQLQRIISDQEIAMLSGKQALDLVKHYGFPKLLLENELFRKGIQLDEKEYQQAYNYWAQSAMST